MSKLIANCVQVDCKLYASRSQVELSLQMSKLIANCVQIDCKLKQFTKSKLIANCMQIVCKLTEM